jgi:hypothetical protein
MPSITRSRQRCVRELRTVGRSRPPMQCPSTAVTLASRAGLLVVVPERASGRRGGVSLLLSHVLSDRTGARRLGLALALVDLALRYGQGTLARLCAVARKDVGVARRWVRAAGPGWARSCSSRNCATTIRERPGERVNDLDRRIAPGPASADRDRGCGGSERQCAVRGDRVGLEQEVGLLVAAAVRVSRGDAPAVHAAGERP